MLSQLRAATSQLHRELDGALGLEEGQITRQKYVEFLQGSLLALAAIEPRLAAVSAPGVASRCELLRSDLQSLGATADVSDLSEAVHIDSQAAAFGARYVIEGSTLGGAILSRLFDKALALEGKGLRYLTLHGAGLAEHWREFLSELEQFGKVATPELRAEACETARAVFMLYIAAFRRSGAIPAKL